MNVTFTGIANGASILRLDKTKGKPIRTIILQLNDVGDQDYINSLDIFEKFSDPLRKGFLKLECATEKIDGKKISEFWLNNKELKMTDENVPIFSKISAIYKRVINGEKAPIEKNYLASDECEANIFGEILRSKSYLNKQIVETAHDPDVFAEGVTSTNKNIQRELFKHFQ